MLITLVRRLATLWSNPFFRQELGRRERRGWAAGLLLLNGIYLGLFAASCALWHAVASPGGAGVRAAYDDLPWLAAGAALLSLLAHWLIPLSLLAAHRRCGELPTVILAVRNP